MSNTYIIRTMLIQVDAGAKLALAESEFPEAKEGTTLVGPQVLVDVDHSESMNLSISSSADNKLWTSWLRRRSALW